MRHEKRALSGYCLGVPDLRLVIGLGLGAVVAGACAIASFDPRVKKVVRRTSNLALRRTRDLAPSARKRAVRALKSSGHNGSRARAATKAV
jgi:hypothetical protein